MKLPATNVVAESRRHAQWLHPAPIRPQDEMATDAIRECENSCRRMFGNNPGKLAKCLSNCG